ncbi:hypothetical protein RQP46_003171 [Phenoliferia psychrophenolica]
MTIDLSVGGQPLDSALASSRHTILYELLTLFSTKSRAKSAPQLVQPAHTLAHLTAATVSLGPHSLGAKLFIADWGAQPKKKKAPPPPPPPAPPPPPPVPVPTPTPAAITPALILRLNAASAADPVLASLLRKAASGGASNVELGGLARYIEGLRREEELQNPTRPPPPPTPVLPPPAAPVASTSATTTVEEPDEPPPPSIVLEFRESPTERFVLPSHTVFTLLPLDYPLSAPISPPPSTPATTGRGRRSVLLSFFVFGGSGKGKAKEGTTSVQVQQDDENGGGVPIPVDLVVEECTEAVRNALWKCSRSSRPRENDVEEWYKRMILAVPPRVPIVARERPPTPPPEIVAPPPPTASSSTHVVDSSGRSRVKRPLAVLGSDQGSGSDAPARRPAKRSKKSAAMAQQQLAQQVYPTTFPELQETLFPTCEDFIAAARRIAASESVSLTVTHKSRNSPGKAATQYRGCLVLNCLQWEHGCTFEIKAYGPVEGGWRMRPLQHPGLKKHTVTSWCICNHPKTPLRSIPLPQISTWSELASSSFVMPDDLIAAAERVSSLNNVQTYLLTLMISDGKPKPNGRNSMYVPRGFLTLECVEANEGCPFAIKAREEADGWYMRPWREKGKGDLKGAVSTLVCKHGPEVQLAYRTKLAEKERKAKASKGSKREAGTPDSDSHSQLQPQQQMQQHQHQQHPQQHQPQQHQQQQIDVQPDIPSGLDPVLAAQAARAYDPQQQQGSTLSQAEIFGAIEGSFDDPSPSSVYGVPQTTDPRFSNEYSVDHFQHLHQQHLSQQHQPIASTSAAVYQPSPIMDPFRGTNPQQQQQHVQQQQQPPSHLTSFDSPSPLPASALKRLHAPPSTAESRAPKRVRARPTPNPNSAPDSSSHPSTSTNTSTTNGGGGTKLNKSWRGFLAALDREGRLAPLNAVLADGGIDPGAVVSWPDEDVREFVDSVATDVAPGVRIHFRVLLGQRGKVVWDELQG